MRDTPLNFAPLPAGPVPEGTQGPAMPRPSAPRRTRALLCWVRRHGTSAALGATVLLPLVLFGASAALSWRDTWREAAAEVTQQAAAAAGHAEQLLEAQLLRLEFTNELLSGLSDAEIRAREPALHERLRRATAGADGPGAAVFHVYVYDREALPLVSSAATGLPRDRPFHGADHLAALAAAPPGAFAVTSVMAGRQTGRHFFALGRRRHGTGNAPPPDGFDGFINASAYVDATSAALGQLAIRPGDAISLIRADGLVLARSEGFGAAGPGGLRLRPDGPGLRAIAEGRDRSVFTATSAVDGREHLIAQHRVGATWPLHASAARRTAAVVEGWARALIPQAAIAGLASLLLLVLARAVLRRQRELAESNGQLGRRVEERTAALKRSESRLRRVQRVGRVGGFEIDLSSGVNQRSGEYMALQGLPPEEAVEAHADWVRRLHPDDRARAEGRFLAAISPDSTELRYAQDYRILTAEGEVRWIAARAEIERDAEGRALRMVGAHVDVTELKQAQAALSASETEFRALFESSVVGKAQIDAATGAVLRVNRRFCEITGHAEEELLAGGFGFAQLIHPEDRAAEAEGLAAALRTGTRHEGEMRFLRADGGIAWVRLSLATVQDANTGAPLRGVAAVQDVTERRAAEERQALLAREVDHRAKNALAVVQAALRLTPRGDAETFAQAVEGRVAALARAQTLLAGNRWSGAELGELLEGELAAFLGPPPKPGEARPRVSLAGAPLTLGPTAAQALSMAFHELATNAVKYGALGTAEGSLSISWEADRAADSLRLRWVERGGPPVEPAPRRRGFGSRVLEGTVRAQLGGKVERAWQAEGLVVEIMVPLARSLSSGEAPEPGDFAG